MNSSTKLLTAIFAKPILLAATCAMIAGLDPPTASATQPTAAFYCQQTKTLECVTEQLDEEIKIHLQDVDGWRKLKRANRRVRVQAAAIGRRVGRDADYGRLSKDIEKLQEFTVKMAGEFDELLVKVQRDWDRGLPRGDLGHVGERISESLAIADLMRAVCEGPALPNYGPRHLHAVPAGTGFAPVFETAPAYAPVLGNTVPAEIAAPSGERDWFAAKPRGEYLPPRETIEPSSFEVMPVLEAPAPTGRMQPSESGRSEQTHSRLHSVLE